ncbi:hypothetical protein Misp03_82220 [Microbispora sp. NBRC 16548]|nr:hypothetical protein Misp03_82220 [Microbispora sp. NBRC 16548]
MPGWHEMPAGPGGQVAAGFGAVVVGGLTVQVAMPQLDDERLGLSVFPGSRNPPSPPRRAK